MKSEWDERVIPCETIISTRIVSQGVLTFAAHMNSLFLIATLYTYQRVLHSVLRDE